MLYLIKAFSILFPKKYLRSLLLLTLAGTLFSSCAFHKEFPFICFLPGCIKQQYNLPDMRAVKKRMQVNRKKRQLKALAKGRKKSKDDNKYKTKNHIPVDGEVVSVKDSTETLKKDSVYALKGDMKDIFVKLIFDRKPVSTQDSLMYNLNEDINDLSEDDKNSVVNYVRITNKETIAKVTIKIRLNKNEKGRHETMYLKHRSKKLKQLLSKENINDSLIEVAPDN